MKLVDQMMYVLGAILFSESFQGAHVHVSQQQFSTCFKYVHFPRVGPHSSPNRNLCPLPWHHLPEEQKLDLCYSITKFCNISLLSSLWKGALNILSSFVLCSLKVTTFIHLLGVGLCIYAIEQVWIQSPDCRRQVSAFTVRVTGIKFGSVFRLGSEHFYLLSHLIAFSPFPWPFYTWPVCSDGSNALTNAFLIISYMVQSSENQILYTRVGRPLEGHVLTSLIVIGRLM